MARPRVVPLRSGGIGGIAGRRGELAAVRRRLESGTGCCWSPARRGSEDPAGRHGGGLGPRACSWRGVRAGRCRPRCRCSRSPTSLRAVVPGRRRPVVQGGSRRLPDYVRASLRRLLPELEEPRRRRRCPTMTGGDNSCSPRSVRRWPRLTTSRPLAVLRRGPALGRRDDPGPARAPAEPDRALPLVGTYRLDDPTVPAPRAGTGSRGSDGCRGWTRLALGPLTRDGTGRAAGPAGRSPAGPGWVDKVYRRAAGKPLFTEQLAPRGRG